jgi:methionine sulfoxide reductase heme-binding subunit
MPAWIWSVTSEPRRHGARTPARHRLLGALLFLLGAGPGLHLAWRWQAGTLGVDPLHTLVHDCGWWALVWLLATLSITPLRRFSVQVARWAGARYGRRWSDWNGLIRHRRQLGLWSFAYAVAHLALYLGLDAGGLAEAWQDVRERPFIALGFASWLMLLPLAATSSRWAMRQLKQHWARLHRLVYPAAIIAVLHDIAQTKAGHPFPWVTTSLCAVLLLARVVAWWRGDRGDAQMHQRQTPQQRQAAGGTSDGKGGT